MAAAVNADDAERVPGSVRLEQLERYLSNTSEGAGKHLGAGYQAFVDLYETPFGNFVVKKSRGPYLWRKLGEAAIRREEEIYSRLHGIAGIPQCLGLLEEKHLVLERVPGNSYRQRQHEIDDHELFFVRLLKTLKEMHAAGVAHGDLKRKDNLLVGPDERPYIIDFGLAGMRRAPQRGFNRLYFDWLKQYDYNAWIKHKYQGRMDAISAEDLGYYRPMRLERIARAIRLVWQKLTFRRYRTRHR